MRVVYEAENVIDAHLVKGLLENAQIPAYVRGEHLTGAMGELPVMGLIAVCVSEIDLPTAERVVSEWRAEVETHPLPSNWDAEPGMA
jgi:hypothetical protein